ncbi:MAG: acyltransferase [Pseudomonadota bacterium]
MKSSTNQYWIALDHVRAFAALLVFVWHFTHGRDGSPVPFEGAPAIFPLALFDEGHVGVAVFMTLSGYLFAKLLDGKDIDYPKFFWNRFIRLAPLLLVVFAIKGVVVWASGQDLSNYILRLLSGMVFPTWPNGGWSITVEMHFYLALPFLLLLSRRNPLLLIGILVAAIAFRTGYFLIEGSVQYEAYRTILGRIDQFVLGMLFFMSGSWFIKRGAMVAAITLGFCAFYWAFAAQGGFYLMEGGYPTTNPIWIAMPMIEGFAIAAAITWYDNNFKGWDGPISRFAAQYGTFSYSIYLLHFFFVFAVAAAIHEHVIALDNFYMALVAGFVCFLAMYPIGWLSYRYIELPFLSYRKRYVFTAEPVLAEQRS